MNFFKFSLSLFILIFIISSCKNQPTVSTLAGKYHMTIVLKNKEKIKEDIKKDISGSVEKTNISIRTSANDSLEEIDITAIDTSTPEGKVEYAVQKMAEGMDSIQKFTEDYIQEIKPKLGSSIADVFDGLVSGLENLSFDVELQEDGDIKLSGFLNFVTSDLSWTVEGNEIVLKSKNDETKRLPIISQNKDGFVCEYEEYLINMQRIK
jgi:hypothetical protein